MPPRSSIAPATWRRSSRGRRAHRSGLVNPWGVASIPSGSCGYPTAAPPSRPLRRQRREAVLIVTSPAASDRHPWSGSPSDFRSRRATRHVHLGHRDVVIAAWNPTANPPTPSPKRASRPRSTRASHRRQWQRRAPLRHRLPQRAGRRVGFELHARHAPARRLHRPGHSARLRSLRHPEPERRPVDHLREAGRGPGRRRGRRGARLRRRLRHQGRAHPPRSLARANAPCCIALAPAISASSSTASGRPLRDGTIIAYAGHGGVPRRSTSRRRRSIEGCGARLAASSRPPTNTLYFARDPTLRARHYGSIKLPYAPVGWSFKTLHHVSVYPERA